MTYDSVFNDEAEKLLGVTADEMHNLKVNNEMEKYDEIFSAAMFKTYIAKVTNLFLPRPLTVMMMSQVRVKQELVKEENRLKYTVIKLDKVNYAMESKLMLDAIRKYD